ncbi:uncharacterized protein N7482_005414 [Penicillium canariense]|uniref:Uncharacterized protein n=1 Tax=Penicillium canariense TaxID=189055 RepID=A0A9W9I4N0_9EURO|nr:uncharacterized protein N7482_005414 [Penicillium canariense]KAJ5166633.1 hypothetical protein N7482_005414 [Penicillium canariense]
MHPGVIGDLYICCVTSYKSLVKAACRNDKKTRTWFNIFQNEYQLLCLWGNDFDVERGGLDTRLERSGNLKFLTLSTLVSLAKSIFRCRRHKKIFKNPELSVKSVIVKLTQAEDALKASKLVHCHSTANNDKDNDERDDESDDESDDERDDERDERDETDEGLDEGRVEDFDDVLEDIKTYTRGLLDLTPSIESPAKDPPRRDLEDSNSQDHLVPVSSRAVASDRDADQ